MVERDGGVEAGEGLVRAAPGAEQPVHELDAFGGGKGCARSEVLIEAGGREEQLTLDEQGGFREAHEHRPGAHGALVPRPAQHGRPHVGVDGAPGRHADAALLQDGAGAAKRVGMVATVVVGKAQPAAARHGGAEVACARGALEVHPQVAQRIACGVLRRQRRHALVRVLVDDDHLEVAAWLQPGQAAQEVRELAVVMQGGDDQGEIYRGKVQGLQGGFDIKPDRRREKRASLPLVSPECA